MVVAVVGKVVAKSFVADSGLAMFQVFAIQYTVCSAVFYDLSSRHNFSGCFSVGCLARHGGRWERMEGAVYPSSKGRTTCETAVREYYLEKGSCVGQRCP